MPTVLRLGVAPVKSLAIQHPEAIGLEETGVPEDRLFFLVDASGAPLFGSSHADLVQIRPTYEPRDERLTLAFPDGAVVEGDGSVLGEALTATFYGGRKVLARLVRGPWNDALSAFAGRPVRLARCVRPGDGSDVEPLTLVSRESVQELARRGGAPSLDARRFRMLFEVGGCEPHEEDSWDRRPVRIGDALIRMAGPVPRCVVTTRDPETGRKDFDTLKIIPSYRALMVDDDGDRGIPFGMYARVEEPGRVRLGDSVEVLG